MKRSDLPNLLYNLISSLGGSAKVIDIFKAFWIAYQTDLKNSGNLFYTWNYDIRWAATELRKSGRMKPASETPKGTWMI